MNFNQLDELDKKVVTALVNGVSDEDIMSTFEVSIEKIEQLRSVAAEFGQSNITSATGLGAAVSTTPIDPEKEDEEVAGSEAGETNGEDGEGDAEEVKHIVTQEDLDANPELVQEAVQVGDEIVLPKEFVEAAEEGI